MSVGSKLLQFGSIIGAVSSAPLIPALTEEKAVAELVSVVAGGAKFQNLHQPFPM
ncbi:hypothetical protein [Mycoplasma wenyonii]|uniref:hypothetical protein n=1 Tax=Mycoplasma wenyonii TaxID=65123 RepID=UPI0002ED591B|nr:hypothetical protein [Mycoplasma wenyonii]